MTFLEVPSSSPLLPSSSLSSSTSFLSNALSNIVPEDSEQREFHNILEAAAGSMVNNEAPSVKPVRPHNGFCVKFKRTDEPGQKVFINICHTTELPEPADISERELTDLLESGDASVYRVPLSLGMPHDELDKKGDACVAYDVIINSRLFRKCCQQKIFKEFVTLLAAQGIEDKYSIRLCRDDYVILTNRKFMGSMPTHYIRDRGTTAPVPLIDEVQCRHQEQHQEQQQKQQRQQQQQQQQQQHGQYNSSVQSNEIVQLSRVQKPGRCVEHLVADIQISDVDSVEELRLEMAKDRIVVYRLSRTEPEVSFCLPLEVNVDVARAYYDYKTSLLRIDVPVSRLL